MGSQTDYQDGGTKHLIEQRPDGINELRHVASLTDELVRFLKHLILLLGEVLSYCGVTTASQYSLGV